MLAPGEEQKIETLDDRLETEKSRSFLTHAGYANKHGEEEARPVSSR